MPSVVSCRCGALRPIARPAPRPVGPLSAVQGGAGVARRRGRNRDHGGRRPARGGRHLPDLPDDDRGRRGGDGLPALPAGASSRVLERRRRVRDVWVRERAEGREGGAGRAPRLGLGRHQEVPGLRRDDQGHRAAASAGPTSTVDPLSLKDLRKKVRKGRAAANDPRCGDGDLRPEHRRLRGPDPRRGRPDLRDDEAGADRPGRADLPGDGVFRDRDLDLIFDLDRGVLAVLGMSRSATSRAGPCRAGRGDGTEGPLGASIGRSLAASPREAGVGCPHCSIDLAVGDPVVVCQSCGTVHHASCWQVRDGCGSYHCALCGGWTLRRTTSGRSGRSPRRRSTAPCRWEPSASRTAPCRDGRPRRSYPGAAVRPSPGGGGRSPAL